MGTDLAKIRALETYSRVSFVLEKLGIEFSPSSCEGSRGEIDDLYYAMKLCGLDHADTAYLATITASGHLRPTRHACNPAFAGDAKILIVAPEQADLLAHLYADRIILAFDTFEQVREFALKRVSRTQFFSISKDLDDLPNYLRKIYEAAGEALVKGKNVVLVAERPGAGTTMIARRLVNALSPLSHEESIEVSRIHGSFGLVTELVRSRPFRAPHHTVSYKGMEGELLLARHGVLFLDEAYEFRKTLLEGVFREQLRDNAFRLVLAWHTMFSPEPTPEKLEEWDAVLVRF